MNYKKSFLSIITILIVHISYLPSHSENYNNHFWSNNKCIAGNKVNLRKRPNRNSKIIKQYYWLQYFDNAYEIGEQMKIGNNVGYWHEIYVKENCSGGIGDPFKIGYIFGIYLQDCGTAYKKYKKWFIGEKDLVKKIMYKPLLLDLRMLPNGTSQKIRNYMATISSSVSYITAYYTWKRKQNNIYFNIFYDKKYNSDTTNKIHRTTIEQSCLATGLIKTGDNTYRLNFKWDNHCTKKTIDKIGFGNISIEPKEIIIGDKYN